MKLMNNISLDNILASIKSSYKQTFSEQQIKELIEGYKEGAEIRAYADPSISDLIMCSLRYLLLEFGNPNNYEILENVLLSTSKTVTLWDKSQN